MLTENLNLYRQQLMGLSIIFVLLYHLYVSSSFSDDLVMFKDGFIGVDFFLVLSGLGLCYSFNNNTLKRFYSRRITRIIPLFFLQVILYNTVFIIQHKTENPYEALLNLMSDMSMMTYFGYGGGKFFNWYVTAILILYILFPILYKLVEKTKTYSYIFVGLLSIIISANYSIEWRYDCLISRIPSFIFGIALYHSKDDKKQVRNILLVSLVFWIYAYTHCLSHFLISTLFAPVLLQFVCTWRQYVENRNTFVEKVMVWFGRYSYEIYISNAFTCSVVTKIPNLNIPILTIVYVVLSILFGFFFIMISRKYLR